MRITDAQDLNAEYIFTCGTTATEIPVPPTPTNAAVSEFDSLETAEKSSLSGDLAFTTVDARPGIAPATSTGSPNTTSPSPVSTNNTLTIALAVVVEIAAIAILVAAISFRKIKRKKKEAYPCIVYSGPWRDNPSIQHLLSQGESRLSDGAAEIRPDDSVSQVNPSASMGPSYPHHPNAPSLISSIRPGHDQSTIGPGRNYSR